MIRAGIYDLPRPLLCDYVSICLFMSDDEDDYLSDKFLLTAPAPFTSPKTYGQRRKESERVGALRNEQNRKKSRRQLEQESREAGLSKSLFERAQEEPLGAGQNKALTMMMKMGFKPGQALGQPEPGPSSSEAEPASTPIPDDTTSQNSRKQTPEILPSSSAEQPKSNIRHLVAPLPLNEWSGESNCTKVHFTGLLTGNHYR